MRDVEMVSGENNAVALSTLAERINAEHRACEAALKTGLAHALAAGELLMQAKGRLQHGEWCGWLEQNFEGSARTAQAYMKVARDLPHLEGAKAQRVADLSFREALKELGSSSVHFSSESNEWYTPPQFIERVVAVLGVIDLDPCADADKSVPAKNHYTQGDDGLTREWRGRVFMNPPYARNVIDEWVEKLLEEYASKRITEGIALVAARTDTEWFHALRGHPRCFVKGRFRFSGHENAAPFPSVVFYLGPREDVFVANFADLGDVVQSIGMPLTIREGAA